MGPQLKKLLSISRPCLPLMEDGFREHEISPTSPSDLIELQSQSNGFYAFESALHVFPIGKGTLEMSLAQWNRPDNWRALYKRIPEECVFFAEDAFGTQFAYLDSAIHLFDPETGTFEILATSLEDWAGKILVDYNYLTGYPLMSAWQKAHGAISDGHRLCPIFPFIAGGKFDLENMHVLPSLECIRYRASLAHQIAHLPDGARIKIEIED